MRRKKIQNISEEALIKFYESEGMSKKMAEGLVSLSSHIERMIKDLTINPLQKKSEDDENPTGFELYETIRYPPGSKPPEEVTKYTSFHHPFHHGL